MNNIKLFGALTAFLYFGLAYANCRPEFHYQDKWLGSDAAYSVKLDQSKTLWLFGDTFLKDDNYSLEAFEPRSFTSQKIIYNSIGISVCGQKTKYFYGSDGKDFFTHPKRKDGFKYWPKDAALHNKKLYLILLDVVTTGEGGFGFKEVATTVAVVENPNENPHKWEISYHKLSASEHVFPGSALLIKDKNLYMYSTLFYKPTQEYSQPTVMLKISLDNLEKNIFTTSILLKSKSWKDIDLTNEEEIKSLMPSMYIISKQGATEMSVSYKPDLEYKYHMIFSGPSFTSSSIMYAKSKHPFYDWSKAKAAYSYPEQDKTSSRFKKQSFCYAAKEHEQYYQPGDNQLVVTYVCNTLDLATILNDQDVYRPVFVNIPLK